MGDLGVDDLEDVRAGRPAVNAVVEDRRRAAIRGAVRLYESKGNLVSAEKERALLR
jgi:hypothetical protein